MNKVGPSTHSCGIPLRTSNQWGKHPFTEILLQKSAIQIRSFPLTPKAASYRRRLCCGTLSKALLKSMYITSTQSPIDNYLCLVIKTLQFTVIPSMDLHLTDCVWMIEYRRNHGFAMYQISIYFNFLKFQFDQFTLSKQEICILWNRWWLYYSYAEHHQRQLEM